MTREEFAAHLKAREHTMHLSRIHWGSKVPDGETVSEATRKMWEAKGAEDAFGAMVTQFERVEWKQ